METYIPAKKIRNIHTLCYFYWDHGKPSTCFCPRLVMVSPCSTTFSRECSRFPHVSASRFSHTRRASENILTPVFGTRGGHGEVCPWNHTVGECIWASATAPPCGFGASGPSKTHSPRGGKSRGKCLHLNPPQTAGDSQDLRPGGGRREAVRRKLRFSSFLSILLKIIGQHIKLRRFCIEIQTAIFPWETVSLGSSTALALPGGHQPQAGAGSGPTWRGTLLCFNPLLTSRAQEPPACARAWGPLHSQPLSSESFQA